MIMADDQLTDIQSMLKESLAKVLERQYDFETRQKIRKSAPGYSVEAWNAYAEIGLLSLGVAEEDGGAGDSLNDLALICRQMGEGLTLEPYLPTVVFGGRLLARAGTDEQKQTWLPGILAGETKVALAHGETHSRYGLNIATKAQRDGDDYVLNGHKAVALDGDCADLYVVSAVVEGEAGLSLFLLPSDAEGLGCRPYRNFDGQGGADLTLNSVRLPAQSRLGDLSDATAQLQQALDEAVLLACSDSVGAMRAANRLTVDYAKVRKQFGSAIGNFQVLQHRMVDMAMAEAFATAITEAAITAQENGNPDAKALVSAAKVRVGESARLVGQQAIQLHGGMGLTEEYPASHYFARLGLFERTWGDADFHIQQFAELKITD